MRRSCSDLAPRDDRSPGCDIGHRTAWRCFWWPMAERYMWLVVIGTIIGGTFWIADSVRQWADGIEQKIAVVRILAETCAGTEAVAECQRIREQIAADRVLEVASAKR